MLGALLGWFLSEASFTKVVQSTGKFHLTKQEVVTMKFADDTCRMLINKPFPLDQDTFRLIRFGIEPNHKVIRYMSKVEGYCFCEK